MRTPVSPPADVVGRVCDIYLNLHLPGYLSLRSVVGPDKGRVIGHVEGVDLRDCEFRVNESGRDRVRRNRCREVHAVVRGTVAATWTRARAQRAADILRSKGGKPVRYHPFETDFFQTRAGGRRVDHARRVIAAGSWLVAALS